MSPEIPEKSIIYNHPDGGVGITVGTDNPLEIIQGRTFYRWGDNSYVSVPDADGNYLVILPPGSENQAVISIRDSNHNEVDRRIYKGEGQ